MDRAALTPEHQANMKRALKIKLMIPIVLIAHCLGILSSFHALMSTRTSQGAIAWIVSLNTFPLISVPAYWVFGRNKFQGYVSIRRQVESDFDEEIEQLKKQVAPYVHEFDAHHHGTRVALHLADLPYFHSNGVELLIDGKQTFASILKGIEQAEKYILVQFYIVRDDDIGGKLKDLLLQKAKEGVKIWFLYDEIGTRKMEAYFKELENGGVNVSSFHSTRGGGNRFQINFRNHRKIVVVDGKYGWVGGNNVGDEYLGNDRKLPNWRDTHMRISGPSVLQLQISFLEDWQWAKDELISILDWLPAPDPTGNAKVLIMPTGPADRLESCSLMYQQAIHSARERIWIASPYFIPDESIMSALHLAALRGVDIKVIIPDRSDSWLVYFSAYAFVEELIQSGIEIYRYEPGFLHQKVFLVDDVVAGVGTANFDNRSFRLNFEITALVIDDDFVHEVETMLSADIARSRLMAIDDVANRPWWFKVLSRAAYLTAPIQ
jgi:cardiolipin synthase